VDPLVNIMFIGASDPRERAASNINALLRDRSLGESNTHQMQYGRFAPIAPGGCDTFGPNSPVTLHETLQDRRVDQKNLRSGEKTFDLVN
jgi:hypothetical protein